MSTDLNPALFSGSAIAPPPPPLSVLAAASRAGSLSTNVGAQPILGLSVPQPVAPMSSVIPRPPPLPSLDGSSTSLNPPPPPPPPTAAVLAAGPVPYQNRPPHPTFPDNSHHHRNAPQSHEYHHNRQSHQYGQRSNQHGHTLSHSRGFDDNKRGYRPDFRNDRRGSDRHSEFRGTDHNQPYNRRAHERANQSDEKTDSEPRGVDDANRPHPLQHEFETVMKQIFQFVPGNQPAASTDGAEFALPAPPTIKFVAPAARPFELEVRDERHGPKWGSQRVIWFKRAQFEPALKFLSDITHDMKGIKNVTVRDLVDFGRHYDILPSAMIYALIRFGKNHDVASLLDKFLDALPDGNNLLNEPIPAKDSWMIHRACWEGNVGVVRLLVRRGVITNRLNEWNAEHPATVAEEGGRQNGVPQENVDAIKRILVNTLFRGVSDRPALFHVPLSHPHHHPEFPLQQAGLPVPPKPEAEQINPKAWLLEIAEETNRRSRIRKLALKEAKSEGKDSSKFVREALAKLPPQRHVFISGIPFEYPMEAIKEWFSACGPILNMHVFVASAKSFDKIKKDKLLNNANHRGMCLIQFATPDCVDKALTYSGSQLLSRMIHVTKRKPTVVDRFKFKRQLREMLKANGMLNEAESAEESEKTFRELRQEILRSSISKSDSMKEVKEIARRQKLRKMKRIAKREEKRKLKNKKLKSKRKVESGMDADDEKESDSESDIDSDDWLNHLRPGPRQRFVHVVNIPYEVSSVQLKDALQACGPVVKVYLPERQLKANNHHDATLMKKYNVGVVHRGDAVVLFENTASVLEAVKLDGGDLIGRKIRVVRSRAELKMTPEEVRRDSSRYNEDNEEYGSMPTPGTKRTRDGFKSEEDKGRSIKFTKVSLTSDELSVSKDSSKDLIRSALSAKKNVQGSLLATSAQEIATQGHTLRDGHKLDDSETEEGEIELDETEFL